jgi:hypothetical protein
VITASLWVVSATAAVRVEGDGGCLAAQDLDLESRSVLGDELVDRYDIVATMEAEPDTWTVHLEVSDAGVPLWRRNLHIVQADCPYVAGLVAVSIERGLSKVPDLAMPGYERQRHVTEGGFLLAFTMPADERIGYGTYLSVGLPRPLRIELALEGFVGFPQQVGTGRVTLFGGPLLYGGIAWQPHVPRGNAPALRIAARAGGGLIVAVGEGFGSVADGVALSPHGSVTLDAIFAFGKQFRVGPRAEYAFARVSNSDVETGDSVEEPAVRVGVTAAYAWPVVRH